MLTRIVLRDAAAAQWLIFASPVDVLAATSAAQVRGALVEVERRVREEQLFAAGFVSYEAASGFDAAFVTQPPGPLPLLCFGLFPPPERRPELPPCSAMSSRDWRISTSRQSYLDNVERIRREIAAGNTYQVNYTVRQRASGLGSPWNLFLQAAADAPYAAYLECEDHTIVSASPELFFELDGERILCRPMKGTAPRGMTTAADREMRRKLAESAKDRAENVMIADMVRNDLGRIASPGTVRTAALFDVEKYRTVWQMTSTVTASTRSAVADIFQALFPSASITGAPKVSSMKLIKALEDSPRQIYTGAVGWMGPERRARFNVAIRTALIDKSGDGIYGVGGGIVWDSSPAEEYDECLSKSLVSSNSLSGTDFRLLETMLWTTQTGFALLEEHLDRLADTAEYFDFALDRGYLERYLDSVVRELPDRRHRVRLLVGRDGRTSSEAEELTAEGPDRELRLSLAESPVDVRNPFLYHKTTERSLYERALAGAGDCDDVLLWNPEGYVTEATIANFVARIDGQLCTPPIECGLLGGTLRGKLLRDGVLEERKIQVRELAGLDELYLINSVRGFRQCRLAPPPAGTETGR